MRKWLIIVVAVAVLAAGGTFTYLKTSKSTTTTSTTTTTTVAQTIAPLTGLPDPTGESATRPALTVKIENIPAALPQRGINYADVIYEEIVEGGITRLAAIFNSHAPSEIGPIRSVRRTDKWIVWPIGGIFAFSGGAAYAVTDIHLAPVHVVSETVAGPAMFRDNNGRVPPNNLYGIGPKLFALGGSPVPPRPLFLYRSAGDKIGGTAVTKVAVNFPAGYAASFTWNSATQSWDRTQFDQPIVTASGARLSPKNVIIQYVDYAGGVGVIGAQAVMLGTGKATFFIGGKVTYGTWSRSDKTQPTKYYDTKGNFVKFTPGQTWVELLYYRDTISITPAVSPTTTTTAGN